MKKLLALILAAFMMVAMFAACGDEEKKAESESKKATEVETEVETETIPEPEKSDEDLIKEVVEKYALAAMTLDVKALSKCVAKDSDLYEQIQTVVDSETLEDQISAMAESVGESFDGDKDVVNAVEEGMSNLLDECIDTIEIDFKDISIDGDEATVEAVLTMMNPESAFSAFADGDYEKYLDDEFKEMSEEELRANVADMFQNIFDNLADEIDNSDFEAEETSAVISLSKIDGEWLITADE